MQSGGNKLRYATLMGIKRAKTKETANSDRGGARRGCRADGRARADLRAEEAKVHADLAGLGQRSSGGAGGEAENGGACPMSILLVLEESNGKIKRASWEALAAAQRLGPGKASQLS